MRHKKWIAVLMSIALVTGLAAPACAALGDADSVYNLRDTPAAAPAVYSDGGEARVDLTACAPNTVYELRSTAAVTLTSGGAEVYLSVKVPAGTDCYIVLDNVNITASGAPAIALEPGASATIELVGDNTLTGGDGYAGLEAGFADGGGMASLTIVGEGSLTARGGSGSAGIGGSFETGVVHGDISLLGGTITAYGGSQGAGIGSARNNGGSHGSYKIGVDTWGGILVDGASVTAYGGDNAAGIGGGDHIDGGVITIGGGSVTAYGGGAAGGAGIGSGRGSHKQGENSTKGPGYYSGGIITITGGSVTATGGLWGAGIGGGYCADSGIITIEGGFVQATGGSSDVPHHGTPGIGGGYEGHGDVTINGGTVIAAGTGAAAGIGSGGTPNALESRGAEGRGPEATHSQTTVTINGGDVIAAGGPDGGAGIGTGFGADRGSVTISGGTVSATGAATDRGRMAGGAGIGSGCNSAGIKDKYASATDLSVAITGGSVTAVGGWGASGIGSGADNTIASDIVISSSAQVRAFSDGTKFAVDTRDRADASTETVAVERNNITGTLLQGTFVNLDSRLLEGLNVELRANEENGAVLGSVTLPEAYRSFALTADGGTYLLYSTTSGAEGWIVYNTQAPHERYEQDAGDANTFVFSAAAPALSDNYYLYLSKDAPDFPKGPEESPEVPQESGRPSDDNNEGYPDEPTPAPAPEPIPAPEPEADTDIEEEQIPLADLPEDPQPAPGFEPAPEAVIEEGEVPLGDLPQTGMAALSGSPLALILMAVAVTSGAAAAVLTVSSLRRREG